jgi:uncharacterized cupredoxin-like copper-binding protein
MAFYLEDRTIRTRRCTCAAGETVRLVLKNEDEGMSHDFAIPGWKAADQADRVEANKRS